MDLDVRRAIIIRIKVSLTGLKKGVQDKPMHLLSANSMSGEHKAGIEQDQKLSEVQRDTKCTGRPNLGVDDVATFGQNLLARGHCRITTF